MATRTFEEYFGNRPVALGEQATEGDEILILRAGTVLRAQMVYAKAFAAMEDNAVLTTIAATDAWTPFGGTLSNVSSTPVFTFASNQFTFVGPAQIEPTMIRVGVSMTQEGGGTDLLGLGIFVNDLLIGTSTSVSSENQVHLTCAALHTFQPGQVVDFRVRNRSDTTDITVHDAQFAIGQ